MKHVIALLILIAAAPAAAGGGVEAYDNALQSYEIEDYADAMAEFKTFAAGPRTRRNAPWQALAAHHVAEMFRHGQGAAPDKVEALRWYHIAAELGHRASAKLRDTLAENLVPAERKAARARAVSWLAREH